MLQSPMTPAESALSRRDFIASLTVAGLGLQLGGSAFAAESAGISRRRISCAS
jgi:hypothetical protein